MMSKTVAVAAVGLACLFGQSYAQGAALPRLTGLQGLVLVDHGDGFAPAGEGAVFKGGDRVTAARGGVAHISYNDGCNVSVDSRSMVTIDSASPCDGGPAPQMIKTANDDPPPGDTDDEGDHWHGAGMVIGGLALFGVGVVVGVLIEHNNVHTVEVPVSP